MAYSLIKLTPTTVAAELALNEVLFDSTEVVLPAHAWKLVSATIVDYQNKLRLEDFALIFHHDNAGGSFGTPASAENLTSANAVLNQPIAAVRCNQEVEGTGTNFNILTSYSITGSAAPVSSPVILSKDKSDDKLFVMGKIVVFDTAGTLDGTNADGSDLAVYLGFEY